jgi:hypothetical protein
VGSENVAKQRGLMIQVREMDGGWESVLVINGYFVGGGTAPTVSGALDVAMDILYGDKSDWLNGQEGALYEHGLA